MHNVASATSLALAAVRTNTHAAHAEARAAALSLNLVERTAVDSLVATAMLREENSFRAALGLRAVR